MQLMKEFKRSINNLFAPRLEYENLTVVFGTLSSADEEEQYYNRLYGLPDVREGWLCMEDVVVLKRANPFV